MNKVATITTAPQDFPEGTIAGPLVVTLHDASGTALLSQTVTELTVSFDVPVGTGFTVSAQRVDNAGQPLGAPAVSAPFDVAAPVMVSIDIPVSVAVA